MQKKRFYPLILEAYIVDSNGTQKLPNHTHLVKSDEQYDSFMRFHTKADNKIFYEIKSRRPKWGELSEYNWAQKVFYTMPDWLIAAILSLAGVFTLTNIKELAELIQRLIHK